MAKAPEQIEPIVEDDPVVVNEPTDVGDPPAADGDEPLGFDDVFASLSDGEVEADNLPPRADSPDVAEAKGKKDAAKGTDDPLPDPADVSDDPADPPADDPADPPADDPADPPADDPAPAQEDILNKLADLMKKQPAEEQAQPQLQEEPDPLEGIYSDDEATFLKGYDEEWGDVAKGEALKRRAEYQLLVNHVYDQIATALMPHFETLHAVADKIHHQDLTTQVEDYDDIREKVVSWVDTQPEYLQNAYNHVIDNGTADEVADLISRFKQATGTVTPAQQADTKPVPAKKPERVLPKATKQAAASLAPVSSKRSVVTSGDDPNDFDGAFATFADKV